MNKIKWWLKRNLKYLFKINQMVSDLVYDLMLDNNPRIMYLSRFDINSFYPSTMFRNAMDKFSSDTILNSYKGGHIQAFNNLLYGIMEEKK